tara:strand:+ start:1106 stop:3136 length:2031 start_codon:yes stop_codon:yes gene_type:complete
MCGIYGVITKSNSDYDKRFLKHSLKILSNLSQSRGKDSSGLCFYNDSHNRYDIIKGPISSDELLKKESVKNVFKNVFSNYNIQRRKLIFGHSRLVTNGSQINSYNNQPVFKDGIICIHNGIIVNADNLWIKNKNLLRKYEIDTEILPTLVRKEINYGHSIEFSVKEVINKIYGTVSAALSFVDIEKFILATNNGSLYVLNNEKDIIYFASELYILKELSKKLSLNNKIGDFKIFQLKTNNLMSIDLNSFNYKINSFEKVENLKANNFINISKEINFIDEVSNKKKFNTVIDLNKIHLNPNSDIERKLLIYPIDKIKEIKRCNKCLLPETFPFIEFDNQGICNVCKNQEKNIKPKSLNNLKELIKRYKSNDGSPDCLVPFSGGRDSMYTLHFVKRELGLNPIAFTYDWGMVTDLARRNISRICGKLGVENIIVAADIHWKRTNIRKNLKAWLKNPELGMIPLLMAGDKYFFYYSEKIKKQNGIKLNIWGINDLENTDFKTGFAGLAPQFDKKNIYSLSLVNKFKLFGYVGRNVINSPAYLNQSVFDSLGSFASRYIISKSDYYHLFDFITWDEKKIEDTIIKNYNWETCLDTSSTWRIGDGTASFYNYVYTLVAGFSENDTFRSNQIREGMISREEGLRLIYEENKPRYNSLKWYLEIIGLDFKDVIEKVNKIPRLY